VLRGGVTQAKVVEGLSDAVIELTETGSTIKASGLRIVYGLMESVQVTIVSRVSWEDPWKKAKIRQIAT
jgi:ATP phosphoribosyltransferase